ncbi:MAG: glycosyltransferase [Vulcanisaeta sp. AZ3]|jgi:cellulose synthase/poly-beta-1,6-N-acetylglucosamine synthase-like glycosyltransferase
MSINNYVEIKELVRQVVQQYIMNQYPWGIITSPLTPIAQIILAITYVVSIIILILSLIQVIALVRYGVRSLRYVKKSKSSGVPRKLSFITILIPIKSESPLTIERSLHNIAGLNYPKNLLEVIFISDDPEYYVNSLRNLINDFARRLGINISIVRRAKSVGYKGGALNYGLKYARGDMIAIFDIDTMLPRNYLLNAVNMLQSRYDAVTAVWKGYYSVDNVISRLVKFMYDVYNEVFIRGRFLSNGFPAISGNNIVIWRRVLNALNGFCECTGEDLDLSIRLRAMGYRVGLLNEDVYCEVPHDYLSLKKQFSRWLFNGVWNLRHNTLLLLKSRETSLWEKIDGILWMLQFPSMSFAAISILITAVLSLLGVIVPPIQILLLETLIVITTIPLIIVLLILSKRTGYGLWNTMVNMARSTLLAIVMSFPMLIYSIESLLTDEWVWIPTPKDPHVHANVSLRGLAHEILPIPILVTIMALLLINGQFITVIYIASITAILIYGLRLLTSSLP